LETLGLGHRDDVAQMSLRNGAGVADEESGKARVVVPSRGDGLVSRPSRHCWLNVEIDGRDVGLRADRGDVALALLARNCKGDARDEEANRRIGG